MRAETALGIGLILSAGVIALSTGMIWETPAGWNGFELMAQPWMQGNRLFAMHGGGDESGWMLDFEGSVHGGHEGLLVQRGSDIRGVVLARRQLDRGGSRLGVRHRAEQVADAVEPRPCLVVSLHHLPRSLLDVRVAEHLVLGRGVVHPART